MKQNEFYKIVTEQLADQFESQKDKIEETAQIFFKTIKNDQIIHAFGCGHSQMFVMEMFYRAGGLVPINAILTQHLSLAPTAKLSTFSERIPGLAKEILDNQTIESGDCMVIASISGRNNVPIEMALEAKAKGMVVIALTSLEFSKSVDSRHESRNSLYEVADIVIDIKCESGDACLSHPDFQYKFCGTSTVLTMTVIQAIIGRTIELLIESGETPPVFVSSNLDTGDAINAKYLKEFKNKIEYF